MGSWVVNTSYFKTEFLKNSHLRVCSLIFRERGREKQRQRNIDQLPPVHAPTGDRTCNSGMCPDREWNCDISVCRTTLQSTEPPRPGQGRILAVAIHVPWNLMPVRSDWAVPLKLTHVFCVCWSGVGFFKYILLIMHSFPNFSPFIPPSTLPPQPSSIPPLVHVHGLYI